MSKLVQNHNNIPELSLYFIQLLDANIETEVQGEIVQNRVVQTGCIDKKPLCLDDPEAEEEQIRDEETPFEKEYNLALAGIKLKAAVYCCSQDLCNSSEKLTRSMTSVISVLVAYYYYYYWME